MEMEMMMEMMIDDGAEMGGSRLDVLAANG